MGKFIGAKVAKPKERGWGLVTQGCARYAGLTWAT